jgi:RNA polymerase sigma-70 factor (ECF subfamily)
MRGIQSDDARAFEALYNRNAALAWRLANSICRDAGRAEDVVQDAFVSAWRSRASYRHETGSVRSWLMAIVRTQALDSIRRETAARRPPLAGGRRGTRRVHRVTVNASALSLSPDAANARAAKPEPPAAAYTNGGVTPHAAFLALRYAPGPPSTTSERSRATSPGFTASGDSATA